MFPHFLLSANSSAAGFSTRGPKYSKNFLRLPYRLLHLFERWLCFTARSNSSAIFKAFFIGLRVIQRCLSSCHESRRSDIAIPGVANVAIQQQIPITSSFIHRFPGTLIFCKSLGTRTFADIVGHKGKNRGSIPLAFKRLMLNHLHRYKAAVPCGREIEPVAIRRVGPDLVCARLWKESGIPYYAPH
jgi:hypothetical protein